MWQLRRALMDNTASLGVVVSSGLINPEVLFSGDMSGSGTTWTATIPAAGATGQVIVCLLTYEGTGLFSTGRDWGTSGTLSVRSADNQGSPAVNLIGTLDVLSGNITAGSTLTMTFSGTPAVAPKVVLIRMKSAIAYENANSASSTVGVPGVSVSSLTAPYYAIGFATYTVGTQSYSTPTGWTDLSNTGTRKGDIYCWWVRTTSGTSASFSSTQSQTGGAWLAQIIVASSS